MQQALDIFYNISQLLLFPVLIAIYGLFLYALVEIGRFSALWWFRKRERATYLAGHYHQLTRAYPLTIHWATNPDMRTRELETYALKLLEPVRIATRVTPMLGLIATLIPMGPALMALSENNVFAMSDHLRTAFTAVIIGLSAASLTYWVASVKRRWLVEELTAIERQMEVQHEA
ncbi:MAG: MotA/TolQ/ExbB proton channel family protein [Nitrospirales bacterium]